MREKPWLLLALYGILLAHAVSAALKARPKFKIATTSTTTTTTTTEEPHVEENDNVNSETTTVAVETNGTTGHTLTGIPQIDYIWDPNLPRELNGYNLSDYPFYNSIPEDIDFKCDGLHDGFYASVPHKCQVYHHCLFGTRYDFLCANFTAFDQKTFICHFVSEVDCANSKKYWHRNDALYQVTTTTTTTTTTMAPSTVPTSRPAARERIPPRRRPARRRPYDYYEDYYDEYDRPSRDFAGRDDYDEYDDRKYRRDRDREFRDRDRDRDFRDRDAPSRGRDGSDRDRDAGRDRYSSRSNRRDPPRSRDPLEDDVRPRGRNPDAQGIRSTSREVDDLDVYDRRTEPRNRDTDERRYSDKRYRDDYDDKEITAPSASATSSADGLVKPAAPSSSVYARPRAPPKIRRPVPLSEQDRYAYKTTPAQPTEEPRRRPVDFVEDDYYDDELEDVRPIRRPLRRRPSYRDRDRDREYYETRDRDRLRPRYHSSPEEVRLRTHQDRSRDRYYERDRERGRDRALDRGKDRNSDRSSDRGRSQDAERPYSPRLLDRDRDERPRSSSRLKDLSDYTTETSRRSNSHDRTTEKTTTTTTATTTTTTTCLPEQLVHKSEVDSKDTVTDRSESPSYSDRATRPIQSDRVTIEDYHRDLPDKSQRTNLREQQAQQTDYQDKDVEGKNEQSHQPVVYTDEYSSEYYDEPLEDPPSSPPPRTTVRIVKRPFLPSRGGSPNPRGLSSVGSKAPHTSTRDEETSTDHRSTLNENEYKSYYVQEEQQVNRDINHQESQLKPDNNKQTYDAYKTVQNDRKKQRQEEYEAAISRPTVRRPIEKNGEEVKSSTSPENLSNSSRGYAIQNQSDDPRNHQRDNLAPKWTENYSSDRHTDNLSEFRQTPSGPPIRSKVRVPSAETTPNVYSSTYKSEDLQDYPTGPGNSYRVKQRINEVTHRFQDIPESEYDVTLNDALTPTLIQEANLPSGFVLPVHRQLGRDTVLQSSENNYKLSRPINQQQQQQQPQPQPQPQHQHQHQHQQKVFPNHQFLPTSISNNDRGRSVYYRTPEAVQISGAQYRQQRPWQDYVAY